MKVHQIAARALALLAGVAVAVAGAALAADAPAYPNTSGIGAVPKNEDWYRQCLRVEKAAPASADLPYAQSAAAGCDAQTLYYDTKNQPGAGAANWRQVRDCAAANGDNSILMMLYANGMGVAKTPDMALKYACGVDGAGAEMRGRVAHLLAMGKSGGPVVFDQCDDITSGFMQGVCTQISERQNKKARNRHIDALAQDWPPSQQAALRRLRAALDEFARIRGDEETDLSGTARAAMAIQARADEADRFSRDIDNAEQAKLPRLSAARFAALDKKLNLVYRKIMDAAPPGAPGLVSQYATVTKDNVRHAQRAWLAYRDALVGFGVLRYPAIPASAWKAMLTERRIVQLSELLQ